MKHPVLNNFAFLLFSFLHTEIISLNWIVCSLIPQRTWLSRIFPSLSQLVTWIFPWGPGWSLVASPGAMQGLGFYWLCFHFQHRYQKFTTGKEPTTGRIKCFTFQRIVSEALILVSCIRRTFLRPPSSPLDETSYSGFSPFLGLQDSRRLAAEIGLWTGTHSASSLSCSFCFSIFWRSWRTFKLVLSFMADAITSKFFFFLMLEKLKNILPGSSHLHSEQRSLGREIYKGIKKSKSNKVSYVVKAFLVAQR